MSNSAFIWQKWETQFPYYALMKLDEERICTLKNTWGSLGNKGVRIALTGTFGAGWGSVVKEAGKQSLKYGGRKALGFITGVVCGYFGSASVVLLTKFTKVIKCAKVCHSACSGGLDFAEFCARAPMNLLEIAIFGRPVIMEGQGLDLFSADSDPIEDLHDILKE